MTDRKVSNTFLGPIKFARAISRSHLLRIFNILNVVFSKQLTCSKLILSSDQYTSIQIYGHSGKRCQLTPWAKFYQVSFMLRAHLSQWKPLTQLICHRNVCFLHRWLIFLDPCGFNPSYNLKSEQSVVFLPESLTSPIVTSFVVNTAFCPNSKKASFWLCFSYLSYPVYSYVGFIMV